MIADIIDYNKKQQEKIKPNDIIYDWFDSDLYNLLTYKLPLLSLKSNNDDNIALVNKINKYIKEYNNCNINYNEFLQLSKNDLIKISEVKFDNSIYGFNYYEYYKEKLELQNRLFLYGPAGIGKTYFIYQLANYYQENNLKYVVVYCKYGLNTNVLNDVAKLCENERWILLIDAINELNSDDFNIIIEYLNKVEKKDNLSIIVTFRQDNISLDKIEDLCYTKREFNGIDISELINDLTTYTSKDISALDDIIICNNPLYMNMLLHVMKKNISKINKETIKSICYLFEYYVKTLNNHSLNEWILLKDISKKMFDLEVDFLSIDIITQLNKYTLESFNNLVRNNLIIKFTMNNTEYYKMALQYYSDYLLSRNLFDYIDGNQFNLNLIKNKLKKFPRLKYIFLNVLFEKEISLNNFIDYLENCKISFNPREYKNIYYIDDKYINCIQEFYGEQSIYEVFSILCGINNKPYNCTNYINKFFNNHLNGHSNYLKFLKGIEWENNDKYVIDIQNSLKRIINTHNILNKSSNSDEYIWYSIWCLGIPNKSIKLLAIKALIILSKDLKCVDILINICNDENIYDNLIKQSIYIVLTSIPNPLSENLTNMFKLKLNDKYYLHCSNLVRICYRIYNDPTRIIDLNKGMPLSIKQITLSDENIKIIKHYCSSHKYDFNFDCYVGQCEFLIRFLNYPKEFIREINKKLNLEYRCIVNGDCKGSSNIPQKLIDEFKFDINKKISSEYLFSIFAKYFDKYIKEYNFSYNYVQNNNYNSLLQSIVELAYEDYIGLVTNTYYYEYISANDGSDFVGFKPYNPLFYQDVNFNSIIPIYNKNVIDLENQIVRKFKFTMDIYDTKENILKLIEPIKKRIDNTLIEWVPIALYYDNNNDNNRKLYNFFIDLSDSLDIDDDLGFINSLPKYYGHIKDYKYVKRDNICHLSPSFEYGLDFDRDFSIVLPPAYIINKFSLKFNSSKCSWTDEQNNVVIIINSLYGNHQNRLIKYSMFIRKDFLESIGSYCYCGYTEEYVNGIYTPEKCFRFVINNREFTNIIQQFTNQKNFNCLNSSLLEKCKYCENSYRNIKDDEVIEALIKSINEYKD